MKAFVHKTSGMRSLGEVIESENLETLCNWIMLRADFKGFSPELVISWPDRENPFDEREKQCDWVIEIYDDYREWLITKGRNGYDYF